MTPAAADRPPSSRHHRLRLALAAVLAVLLLATLGVLVWLLAVGGSADSVQRSREEVMAQSRQFMLRMGTYGPDMLDDKGGMPSYRKQVTEVITPKFAESFEEQAGTAEQLVAQAGVERSVEVFSTGVSTIDEDSARALVAGAFHDSFASTQGGQQQGKGKQGKEGSDEGDQRIESEPVPFRLQVDLVKVDGEWLVDDFNPAGSSGDDATPAPSGTPSPSPQGGGGQ